MLAAGDIHVYVTDMVAALRFWGDGLGLDVVEKELTAASGYARLDFPGGETSVRLMGPVDPWEPDARPSSGSRPGIAFDVLTTTFDDTLVRLLEHGGRQMDEIETYEHQRLVTIADPDGNTFELIEVPDET